MSNSFYNMCQMKHWRTLRHRFSGPRGNNYRIVDHWIILRKPKKTQTFNFKKAMLAGLLKSVLFSTHFPTSPHFSGDKSIPSWIHILFPLPLWEETVVPFKCRIWCIYKCSRNALSIWYFKNLPLVLYVPLVIIQEKFTQCLCWFVLIFFKLVHCCYDYCL